MTVGRYPTYQDSGVGWLNEIPSHWRLRRLGYHFNEHREKVSDQDYAPLSVTKRGILTQLDTAAKTDDGDNRKRVSVGDFVINSRSDRKGSGGVSPFDGSVSLINTVLTPTHPLNMRFVEYLLTSIPFQQEFYRFGKGIVADLWSTNFSEMRNIVLTLPDQAEQSAIAAFLDRETGKIDALVAEQERLIALLKEKRQAVISQAVTKGFDPRVPMKPSSVEWLGDVPANWRVGKCGFYVEILPGFAFPSEGFTQNEADTRLLRGVNLGVSAIKWDDVAYWKRTINDNLNRYELREGDLVVGMDRPWIAAGVRVARLQVADLPCLLLQRVARLSTIPGLEVDYLYLLLSSEFFGMHCLPETTGVSVPHISADQIKEFVIPIPPVHEQQMIVDRLVKILSNIDALTAEAERTIALLKERRAALISAAVTGKIDVRHLADLAAQPAIAA